MSAPAGQRMLTRGLADAVAKLPQIIPFESQEITDAALMICVLGFEDRCLAVPNALKGTGTRARAAAVCRYPTNPVDNESNDGALRQCLSEIAQEPLVDLEVAGDIVTQIRMLIARLKHHGEPTRVLLDISVASNALIIRALAALLDADVELHVLYAEADRYRPTRDEYEAQREGPGVADRVQLAHGVLDVTITSEFPGRHAVTLPQRVVVFPGFDRDRVRAAVSQVDNDFIMEPGRAPLIWMIGRPLHDEGSWRQQAVIDLHDVHEDHEQHSVSTFDYREAMYALEDVHRRFGVESNISLVPLGSKMQALGITLFCLARREIALVVSQPREYSAVAYSRGFRALGHLPLGRTSDICRSLRSVDTIRLEPFETMDESAGIAQ